MRRILYIAIPLFALGGCTVEMVDPDYQEDEYQLDVAGEPRGTPEEEPATFEQLRDPTLSHTDGEPHGPTPYPWIAQDSSPSGPTPYPWEEEKEGSGGNSESGEGSEGSEGSQNKGTDGTNSSGSQEQTASNG